MKTVIKKAPDGGWGWMVVIGAALTNMANQALVSIFGLMYGPEIYKTAYGIQGVALVMNISAMVTNFSGLLTGPLLKNYSPRVITFVGVLLTSCGLILSSFANTILHFIITYSVFTGLGLGLIMPGTFMAVNSYFVKRKGQAVGLAMAGTGIGQTLMPQVVRLLLDKYEYRGTTLIMGAISLHGLVGALLFQPVEWHQKTAILDNDESLALLAKGEKAPSIYNENSQETQIKSSKEKVRVDVEEKDAASTPPKRLVLRRIASALDLELLKDPIFVHIIIGLSIVYASSIAFSMLFPFHLTSIGLSRAQTAMSMSLLSAADISARLTIPAIASKLRLGSRITFLYGALMLAFCRSLLAVQTTLEAIHIASVLCGYVRAATVINQNLTVSEYSEDGKKLPSALGLAMVAKGLVVLTLGQFFGWIRDYTSSYTLCIHVQSVCLLLVAFTWGVEILHRKLTTPRTS